MGIAYSDRGLSSKPLDKQNSGGNGRDGSEGTRHFRRLNSRTISSILVSAGKTARRRT